MRFEAQRNDDAWKKKINRFILSTFAVTLDTTFSRDDFRQQLFLRSVACESFRLRIIITVILSEQELERRLGKGGEGWGRKTEFYNFSFSKFPHDSVDLKTFGFSLGNHKKIFFNRI